MRLEQLMEGIEYVILQDDGNWENKEVQGIAKDSREAKAGDVFVCIKGTWLDGHAYIWDTYAKDVMVYVVEKRIMDQTFLEFPKKVTVIQVQNTRETYALMAANFWGHPEEGLSVIGITGTKGKTTVSLMVKTLLEQQGERTGIIGTLGIFDGEEWISTKNTTPDAFTIHEYFGKMKGKGCRYVIMEVSSQGIKQRRIHGINFEIAVFTNLGEDHIGPEEHRSLEEYRYYKSQLFGQCRKGICNLDDLSSRYMFRRKKCEKYGYTYQKERCSMKQMSSDQVLQAEKVKCVWRQGIPFTSFQIENTEFFLSLPGQFNLENALAALQVMRCLSYDIKTMNRGLSDIVVSGRMERIPNDKNIACYIDYAHNGMSLKKALIMLRTYRPSRIILVFGCGGNRAKLRRIEMGEVAGKYADYVIITNDNPRYEIPETIAADIVEGIGRENKFYKVILDRKEAIYRAIEMAEENDLVLIAGKGHETYQEIEGIRYEMDDHELLQEALLRKG